MIIVRQLLQCLVLLLLLPLLARPALAAPPVVLVMGDSLSAGFGMDVHKSWPALLQQRLREEGYPHRVVNASISGETTRGGRARLPAVLEEHQPDIVILELGGNDGLRGLRLGEMQANLASMIAFSKQRGAQVLLAGMKLPPNYGTAYTEKFHDIYRQLAKRYETELVPFLLDGIGGNSEMMQLDMVHPRVEAQPQVLENVWPHLEPLLKVE